MVRLVTSLKEVATEDQDKAKNVNSISISLSLDEARQYAENAKKNGASGKSTASKKRSNSKLRRQGEDAQNILIVDDKLS